MAISASIRRLGEARPHFKISVLAWLGLWLIIPSGALVRLTGSGLGCTSVPPYCTDGTVLPPLTGHALIEYTNRLFSGLVVALTLFAWIVVRRSPGGGTVARWWAAAGFCSAAQAPLGALTVAFELNPLLVSAHFLLSIVALGAGTVGLMRARDRASGSLRGTERSLRRPLAIGTAFALSVALVTGVLVTAAGPHSGDRLKNRRLGNLTDAAYIHVRAAFTFAALALVLGVWIWRRGGLEPLARRLVAPWLVLVGIQIFLGEWQYRHGFPWQMILAHVTIAGLLWTVTVALVMMIGEPAVGAKPLQPPVDNLLTGDASLGVGADT